MNAFVIIIASVPALSVMFLPVGIAMHFALRNYRR